MEREWASWDLIDGEFVFTARYEPGVDLDLWRFWLATRSAAIDQGYPLVGRFPTFGELSITSHVIAVSDMTKEQWQVIDTLAERQSQKGRFPVSQSGRGLWRKNPPERNPT